MDSEPQKEESGSELLKGGAGLDRGTRESRCHCSMEGDFDCGGRCFIPHGVRTMQDQVSPKLAAACSLPPNDQYRFSSPASESAARTTDRPDAPGFTSKFSSKPLSRRACGPQSSRHCAWAPFLPHQLLEGPAARAGVTDCKEVPERRAFAANCQHLQVKVDSQLASAKSFAGYKENYQLLVAFQV